MDQLPSLSALRAFEASARHLSMTLAANELHVTPGAISLQIRDLETALGVRLFERRTRSLALTSEGAEYFATMRTAFRLIREATAALAMRSKDTVLTVTCTAGFATHWLVPRLRRFEEAHPDIDLRISASHRMMDFQRDGIDIAIRHGLGGYEGLASERLLDDEYVPVCTPETAATLGPSPEVDALANLTLIHDVYRRDWELWLQAAGATRVDAMHGPVFTDGTGAYHAMKAGLGIALMRRSFVEQELAEGTLVAPFPIGFASALAYHLVYPPGALERPAIAALRSWLFSEVSRTVPSA
ncbi:MULTISPECIES: transcriptional regulator GcvA [unclassified Rhizobium]|jgi:LysR family glycine cleavage system transcriptional activator|uniref:transcriptional regulator GcvA n=1 Tax=unclassified Rhizobium TaxID=2613769 RepID=UPI00160EEEF9|nr:MULTISPECIES: transcriptional regulator GcvA [unclassified Rhizobium]MBB3287399.1 LysR family glycine cleavage system transcriptional activator [Rhizobium sp. BK252]MBB3402139.1 LysR family glycine cleavage system transcriptional activator [Rhizobium sp. BK289]MBB3414716.1 LysR family glycine cleavage system transcriptional activator [Rhizobium sp. BK284]MBB3482605.1 LysR family glycine cleavage system transcriptional activator [Rhizobium sp. BK347]MDK4721682.1 transcriptional regulator Gcv